MGWNAQKARGNVISSYRNTGAATYNNTLLLPDGTARKWASLSIINESTTDSLTFRVNGLDILILKENTFDDDFEPFDTVEVISNVAHSIVMRG
jgi:hypothetical protein